jgi:hypothetical protein
MDEKTRNEFLETIPSSASIREEMQQSEEYKNKISKGIQILNRRIALAKEQGLNCTGFVGFDFKYESEFKRLYKEKGYWFKPTGYIGGVRQDTEEICW